MNLCSVECLFFFATIYKNGKCIKPGVLNRSDLKKKVYSVFQSLADIVACDHEDHKIVDKTVM